MMIVGGAGMLGSRLLESCPSFLQRLRTQRNFAQLVTKLGPKFLKLELQRLLFAFGVGRFGLANALLHVRNCLVHFLRDGLEFFQR